MAKKYWYAVLVEAVLGDDDEPEASEGAVRQAVLADIDDLEAYPIDEDADIAEGDTAYLLTARAVRVAGSMERRLIAPDNPELWEDR